MDVCDSENVLEEAMFTPERLTYMTERRRLEQLLRDSERKLAERVGQLEAIFEAMVDGVIVFDGQGHLLHMNRAARDLLGLDTIPDYSLHLAYERPSPYQVCDEQGQPLFVEQWPLLRVMKGEILTGTTAVDVFIRTPDGREIQLNVSGAPVRDQDGHIDGAVMVMRDVTERRRLEQHANEIALRETKGQMDEFLGIASHELRTPLTTIKGNIQLAKLRMTHYIHSLSPGDDEPRGDLTEIQTMLDRAERQVNVQNRLVSDLLDISRIGVDKLELRKQPCDLAAIVLETVEDLRSANLTRPIHLELAQYELVPIFADAERIGQVVSNYLTNALKYSPADSPVEVRLKKEGKLAYVSVRDEGPGLTLSEQERIWERFYRAPGVERQRGFSLGLGLGLHICRAIIEQHEGKVGVESKKGVGSTFWFTLPLIEANDQVAG
jgi:signal transduction histidine kinase